MKKSLLTHIASNFISEYENVANSSMSYLLNEYSCAREVLKNILDSDKVPNHYKTELATKNNGRPDITGLDSNGEKTVIIEGKFWANLTSNQPNNYLKELADNGKVLFLAPEKRLNSLQAEIDKRIDKPASNIKICSWLKFINGIESENNKNHNQQLASDLIQFKELCLKMDAEGMPPLSESDLDPVNGKRLSHFSDIIDECNSILRQWKDSDFKRTKTQSQKYGHGFYFYGHNFGCWLEFNSEKWFSRDLNTPIWLDIATNNWDESEKINHYMKAYDAKNSIGSDYGICLKTGMDKKEAVSFIVGRTKDILSYLNEKYNKEN